MSVTVVFIALLGCAVLIALGRKKPTGHPAPAASPSSTIQDVPTVLAALAEYGANDDFAVFLFGRNGQSPAEVDALNIQFSIEGEQLGIDWVLLAPLNVEAQSQFVGLFEKKGRAVHRREQNGVESLRVEGEGLAELLQELLRTTFGVTDDQMLIVAGFDWDESP